MTSSPRIRIYTDETRAKKRIRDARYRLNNCGRLQQRIKLALRKRRLSTNHLDVTEVA